MRSADTALVTSGAQHDELVAAVAHDRVAFAPTAPRRRSATADHQLVADLVAVGVVDLLEAVEVDEEDPDATVDPADRLEHVVEALAQEPPVGQAGEAVVEGQLVRASRGPRWRRGSGARRRSRRPDRDDHQQCQEAVDVRARAGRWPSPSAARRRPWRCSGPASPTESANDPTQVAPGARRWRPSPRPAAELAPVPYRPCSLSTSPVATAGRPRRARRARSIAPTHRHERASREHSGGRNRRTVAGRRRRLPGSDAHDGSPTCSGDDDSS